MRTGCILIPSGELGCCCLSIGMIGSVWFSVVVVVNLAIAGGDCYKKEWISLAAEFSLDCCCVFLDGDYFLTNCYFFCS
jgi:hypothetical protein